MHYGDVATATRVSDRAFATWAEFIKTVDLTVSPQHPEAPVLMMGLMSRSVWFWFSGQIERTTELFAQHLPLNADFDRHLDREIVVKFR